MGSTLSTAHRLEIRRALYLTPSNKKMGAVIRGHLLPLTNYLQQWAVRLSTAHRLKIRRALYLTPSNKKNGAVIRGHLLPLTKNN